MGDPRIGKHHVEPAEVSDDAIHVGLHLGAVTDVHADRDRPAAAPDDLLGDDLGLLDLTSPSATTAPSAAKSCAVARADAERSARDGHHPSVQRIVGSPQAGELVAVGRCGDLERVDHAREQGEVVGGGRQLDEPLRVVALVERVESRRLDAVGAHELAEHRSRSPALPRAARRDRPWRGAGRSPPRAGPARRAAPTWAAHT